MILAGLDVIISGIQTVRLLGFCTILVATAPPSLDALDGWIAGGMDSASKASSTVL